MGHKQCHGWGYFGRLFSQRNDKLNMTFSYGSLDAPHRLLLSLKTGLYRDESVEREHETLD